MRLRLPLAAVLASGADVILLDEPFRALDESAKDRVSEWLAAASKRGATVVIADDEHASRFGERTVVVRAGRIVEPSGALSVDRTADPRELVRA